MFEVYKSEEILHTLHVSYNGFTIVVSYNKTMKTYLKTTYIKLRHPKKDTLDYLTFEELSDQKE